MANLVVNYLSVWLSKIIKNYSSDQLNVSLLKGEVNLRDFEVDVNVINVYSEAYVPFLRITKLKVSDVGIKLPTLLGLKNKPTLVTIGHIDIECIQRDFSQPSAMELVGKDWLDMTQQASEAAMADPDNEVYGLIKKVIDGVRIEIDSIHVVLKLDGLPRDNPANPKKKQFNKTQTQANTNENIGNKSSKISNKSSKKSMRNKQKELNDDEHTKFEGEPLIMEIWFIDAIFCQTDSKWTVTNDLRAIRKEQGTRERDFCVFKLLTAKSFNVHFIPHPSRKDRIQTPIFLLQNYPISLKFIIQRSATKGIVKSVSIDWLVELFHIYITQNEWFEINYFIASLIYAQSKQYEYGRKGSIGDKMGSKNDGKNEREGSVSVTEWSRVTGDEPSLNLTTTIKTGASTGATTTGGSTTPVSTQKAEKLEASEEKINGTNSGNANENGKKEENNGENLNPDEENQHLSSGKNLFDSLSLCQPPRFQWNVCKCLLYIYIIYFYTLLFIFFDFVRFILALCKNTRFDSSCHAKQTNKQTHKPNNQIYIYKHIQNKMANKIEITKIYDSFCSFESSMFVYYA